jgi:hypothetical protein
VSAPELPHDVGSPMRLVRATLVAAGIAGLVLVTIVLPAEYGIDPTGVGRATGLFRAPTAAMEPSPTGVSGASGTASAASAPGSFYTSDAPWRSDEMSITLEPGEGAEIKAQMNAGERLVYSWTVAGGGVDVNMHGESLQKGLPDRTYHEGEFEQAGHGAFEAPMAGNHGWFWQNLNDQPVTITVKTAGFYRRLFRP